MDFNGDLSSIFGSLFEGKRADVYLSVTPGIGLEMIQVDYPNKQVKSYSVRPITYNESLRELTNMEEF